LLKLLTPPLVAWPWALPRWPEVARAPVASHLADAPGSQVDARQGHASVTDALSPELIVEIGPPAPPAHERGAELPQVEIRQPVAPEVAASAPTSVLPPVAPMARLAGPATFVWLVGGIVVLWRQAVRVEKLGRILRLADAGPTRLEDCVRAAAAQLGVRPPLVVVVPGLASPAVWGLRPPRLLWPLGLEESLSPAGLKAVLAHELAHLRRRDHWVGWLLLAGGCVWWWHPLFYLLRRRLGREAERACDALAIESAPEARRPYAEALLEVVQRMARPAVAAPALGAASDRNDVERRIVMILKETTPARSPRRWLLAAGLLAALALPAWTLGRPQERGDDKREETPRPAVAAPPTGPVFVDAAPVDKEKEAKIRALEERVRALMKELHELRGLPFPPAPHPVMTAPSPLYYTPGNRDLQYYEPVTSYRDGRAMTSYRLVAVHVPPREEIHLSRVAYKLPGDKAKAIAALLGEVKATVMEIKVDGDKLIVTTTPQAQQTVAELVRLLVGKPGEPGGVGPPSAPPLAPTSGAPPAPPGEPGR